MWILEILGSAGFGSVVGGVFGYLSKREERQNLQMKLNHEVTLLQAKTAASIQIAKMGIEEAKIAGSLAVEQLEAQAFKESQVSRGRISETLKSIVRPAILAVLMYQTYLIIRSLEALSGGIGAFETTEVLNLYRVVVLSVTGLTATAVGWYFAARSSKQFDRLIDKWG